MPDYPADPYAASLAFLILKIPSHKYNKEWKEGTFPAFREIIKQEKSHDGDY